MRGKVPYKGKFVKADNIPVGEPIMLSAKEWQRRNRSATRKNLLFYWIGFPAIVIPLYLGLGLTLDGAVSRDDYLIAIIMAFTYPAIITGMWSVSVYLGRRRGSFTGLFENGIVFWSAELRQGSFVPYGLIRDFEVTRVLRTETLMLEIEGFEDKAPMMAAKVLGDDGLEMLRKIIDMRHDDVGPPDLHVYGGRSSKVSTMAGKPGDVEEGA